MKRKQYYLKVLQLQLKKQNQNKQNKRRMALKVNYEMPDMTLVEGAYLRIQKIVTANVDYEFFEKSDKENVAEELKWETRLENECVVYVWADEQCRQNRAMTVHHFGFRFDFDVNSVYNIYEQAYQQINKYKFGNEGVNV